MSIAQEVRTHAPNFEQSVIDTDLQDIRSASTSKVPSMIEKGMQHMLRHPSLVVRGIERLTEQRSDPAAQALLEHMQPAEITNFLREKGRQAHSSDFYALLENYRSADSICEAMLIGYLSKPAAELIKAGENRDRQQEALRLVNHVLQSFTEALYVAEDKEIVRHVLKLFSERFVVPQSTETTIVDLAFTNRSYQEPKNDAAEITAVLYALNAQLKEHLGYSMEQKYAQLSESETQIITKDSGISVATYISKKTPAVNGDVWGKAINQIHTFDFVESVNAIGPGMLQQIEKKKEYEPLVFSVMDIPMPLEVGNLAVKSSLDRLITETRAFAPEYEWRVIHVPYGRYIVVVGEPREMDEPETYARVQAKMREFVHDEYAKKAEGEMDPQIVDAVINYLHLPIAPETVQKELKTVLPEAQIGLHAIAERGADNMFRRPREQFLRDMGITGICFRVADEGTRIIVRFGKAEFSYLLDWNGKISGLEALSPENREWFELVTLSYLRSQRHPEKEHPIEFEEDGSEGEHGKKAGVAASDSEQESEPTDARVHYLMTLPHGKVMRKRKKSEEDKVKKHWQINLEDLNLLLMMIQHDRKELTNPHSETNIYIANHPYGETVKLLLDELIDRIMHKATAPQWKMIGEKEMLVPTKTYTGQPRDVGTKPDYFMVVYVPEIHDPRAKPIKTQSPGVAEHILELAGQH